MSLSVYHRDEYQDVANIIRGLSVTEEVRTQVTSAFIGLFKTKGQSFNETRFLNATKPDEEDEFGDTEQVLMDGGIRTNIEGYGQGATA
jgi:hypothetical protein